MEVTGGFKGVCLSAAICRGAGERDGYFPFAANLNRIDSPVSVD
ncbi:uncharacterized protein METZ01_LOCUS261430, partial [marine metagenome]